MNRDDFIARHPRLFHMAAGGSFQSIMHRGLLSTRALVDLYRPPPSLRSEILEQVRRSSFILNRGGLPEATIRDQLPLKFIDRCLLPGVTLQAFLDALNGRVFFHVEEERLHRLLNAKAYRDKEQDVFTLDTATLLDSYPDIDLAPYNTGNVHVPNMPARGPSTFERLEDYDLDYWIRRRTAKDAIVELTISHSANIAPAVVGARRWHKGREIAELR